MERERMEEMIKKSKKDYDSIPIPDEYHERMEKTLRQERMKMRTGKLRQKRRKRTWPAVTTAAAAFLVFTLLLNTNEAFAAGVSSIPGLGQLSRVLIFRDEVIEDPDKTITLKVPEVEANQGEDESLAAKVNQEIEKIVSDYEKEANEQIAAYKQAFLDTGGTEEEFAAKDIKVDVSYEITYESEDILSFVLHASENWNNVPRANYYYNLNMKDGTYITLEDLLGENYVEIANSQILAQMEERMAQDPNAAFWIGENGFQTVDENTKFYINENQNPVIVFDRYEIAPGSMGEPSFEIVKE